MHIVCPACSAAYDVPDTLVGAAPRRMRCARCGRVFSPEAKPGEAETPIAAPPRPAATAPPEPVAVEPVAAPEPERIAAPVPVRVDALRAETEAGPSGLQLPDAPNEVARRRELRRSSLGVMAAWAASFVLIASLAASAFVWRERVMTAWPPSERLYAALGLAAPR